MSIILSVQGCMAAGKTTALRYIEANMPYVKVNYEWDNDIINRVFERKLVKSKLDDYVEIQKLWIEKEVLRYQKAIKHSYTVMDFGAEEIEFHTLNYPRAIGQEWDIEDVMHNDLIELRKCLPYRILFLEASEEVLRRNKDNDNTRRRKSFEYYFSKLMPLKREWFANKTNVDVLNVNNLSPEELGIRTKEWIDNCICEYKNI